MSWWSSLGALCSPLVLLLSMGSLAAQTNALILPPSDTRFIVDDEAFEKNSQHQVEQLAKEGKLTDYSYLANHVPLLRTNLTLPPLATNTLNPCDLGEILRHSTVAIGLRYRQPHIHGAVGVHGSKLGKWTYEIAATAFAVAPEILCTSLHVMTIDVTMMREAQAVAVTSEGKIFPITEIVASSNRGDTCFIRAPGLNLPALPLRPGVSVGEPIWCMSHPDGFTYMLTSGIVARISRNRFDTKSAPSLHVEVTAEYCPGSSGGAVSDASGNVVAQVESINQYSESDSRDLNEEAKGVNGIISARTCTAAEEILVLTTAGTNDPIPLPSPESTSPIKKHRKQQ